jgi:large subunit ribosomal protein L22
MKGYSCEIPERCAKARLEDVNASYKDLSEVCGVLRKKKADWALAFLEKASKGEVPVLFRRHNTNLGHRRELGGRKGRYPQKAAGFVLKALQSAIANGKVIGLGDPFVIEAISANKKQIFPRMAPKGRTARSYLVTSRVEIVLTGSEVPKGVSVTPKKKEEKKSEAKAEVKKEEAKAEEKKAEEKKQASAEPPKEHSEHKHEAEKNLDNEKRREHAAPPHAHSEYQKG